MMSYGANSLLLYKFHVDFGNAFEFDVHRAHHDSCRCLHAAYATGHSQCVPQPGTSNKLDSLADRLMYRLAYRNFGTHESLVVSHSVNVSGGGGVRWYEIQSPNATPHLAQQGTYAPDSSYRWMGSAAMDKLGDFAVGYSVSSGAVYPSVAFAGRVPSDPAGALEAETMIELRQRVTDRNAVALGRLQRYDRRSGGRLYLLVHAGIPGHQRSVQLEHAHRQLQVSWMYDRHLHRVLSRHIGFWCSACRYN